MFSLRPFSLIAFLAFAALGAAADAEALPALNEKYKAAYARTSGDILTIGTGSVERQWKWTGKGLVTVAFADTQANRLWTNREPSVAADWEAPGWIDRNAGAQLVSLASKVSDDERFTSKHLEVIAEVAYPAQNAVVRYVVWAYPEAPGIRTQLWVKAPPAKKNLASEESPKPETGKKKKKPLKTLPLAEQKRTDYLPVNTDGFGVRAIGYFNDTQHRNKPATPILREELAKSPVIDWANMIVVEDRKGGLIMLKESHKCANQPGVDTGIFIADENGITNTGWSFDPATEATGEFQWCWATWTIAYSGGDDERELAIKVFDRIRYPIDLERDMWTFACTWGHTTPEKNVAYAYENEVLPEMKSVADLGIDMLLIDGGWQASGTANGSSSKDWKPKPDAYPDGWKNVIALKKKLHLRLGLWGAAQKIPLDAMEWNWEQLKMDQFKLDLAQLRTHEALDEMMRKAREFVKYTNHTSSITWDVTENAPRYGYYWAREYGNVHFMNRKPVYPKNAIYVPWLALRDFWLLSKYNNLNKWQLTCGIPSDTDRELSDAYKHSIAYCAAATFMGIPQFLVITRFYKPEERAALKSLLTTYKKHRKGIFSDYVFPIGDQPNNKNWSGFQAYDPGKQEGYLTIFREIGNPDKTQSIALRFLSNAKLELLDVRTGEKKTATLDKDGRLEFTINNPGDFLFLKYRKS